MQTTGQDKVQTDILRAKQKGERKSITTIIIIINMAV